MSRLTMLSLLKHSCNCQEIYCERSVECKQFKRLLETHISDEGKKCLMMKCVVCKQLKSLIKDHRDTCCLDDCPVPTCSLERTTKEKYTEDMEVFESLKTASTGSTSEECATTTKKRAPYKCGNCGELKGRSHKCRNSLEIISGMPIMCSHYIYNMDDKQVNDTADWFFPTKTNTQSTDGVSLTNDLKMSITSTEELAITLPSFEYNLTNTSKSSTNDNEDVVSKFNKKVKVQQRLHHKLAKSLQKLNIERGDSVNYISDTTSSVNTASPTFCDDTWESHPAKRRHSTRENNLSPTWAKAVDCSIPCETTVDPKVFSPFPSIYDKQGKVIDQKFDDECKMLQAFDDYWETLDYI